MKNIFHFILILMLFTSCSQNRIQKALYPVLRDGKYDSEFPYRNCSKELAKVSESVKMIFSTCYYKTYRFQESSHLTLYELEGDFEKKATTLSYYSSSVHGSGTLIYYDMKRIAMLTCSHIFEKPDTIITFYDTNFSPKIVQSVSIKESQRIFTTDLPEDGVMDILIQDKQADIAILGKEFNSIVTIPVPVIAYNFGQAKQLEWGSFVYLIGYPKGYKIVTKGIVSQPNRDKKGSFLVDALFNTGFSGGIILAIRDGAPNFEMVGIAISSSADIENYLIPSTTLAPFDPALPYYGEIYVDQKRVINYGISQAVSSESIISLIESNDKFLKDRGYNFNSLYNE